MKEAFLLIATLALLASCKQPTDEDTSKITFTVRNQSSYDLSAVKWVDASFASNNSGDLLIGASSTKEVVEDTAYIYFTRKDIGIELRTETIYSQSNSPVTITDNTVVIEVGNVSNSGILKEIIFLPKLTVERNALQVAKDEVLPIGESTINTLPLQVPFSIKNTGKGTLTFTGNNPVKSSDPAFTVIQPTNQTIAPNDSLGFTLNFTPIAEKSYTATVTISSNDKAGDFTFTVSGDGVASKPIINIFYHDVEILQDGMIDMGETFTGASIEQEIIIKNTGAALLTLDTNRISISGDDAAAFSLLTLPSPNISVGTDSKFSIRCVPAKLGESSATITIPTNDPARNPTVFYTKVTGIRIAAPSGLSVSSLTSDSVTLSWELVAGATGYFVYRATSSGSSYSKITPSAVSGLSYTDTGLAASTTYYYKVSGSSSASEGAQSTYVSATTLLAAPSVTTGNTQLILSWTAAAGATAYEVWIGTVNNSASATMYGTDISGASATITGLSNGTTYYVWIKAKNSMGTGDFSAVGSGTPLAPPVNLQAITQSADSILISWNVSVNGVFYRVYRSDSSDGEYTPVAASSTNSYTDAGLSAGTIYYYKVSTVKGSSESALSSSAVSATTQIGSSIAITLAAQNDMDISTQSVVIPRGESRDFQVTGTYTSYQWYLNGSAISGATAALYTLNTASMKLGVYELSVMVNADAEDNLSGSCRVRVE